MGWQQQVITAPVVIIQSGVAGTGLFVYSGAPANGNPPQIAIVGSGVTTDPFGNAVTSAKILMQNNVITESGGIFRTAAAAPLIQLDGPHNAVLVYDAASVLRETIAPVATNDGLGSTVQAGFTAYAATNSTFARLQAAILDFGLAGNTANPSVSGAANAALSLGSGQTAALTVEMLISLLSVAAGAIPKAVFSGHIDLTVAGSGLQIAEGSNAKQGTAVLVAGTVTVANTSVTANSRIFLTCQVPGGTPGFLRISARTAGTSFTILSSSGTDTSTVAYEIFEPG